MKLILGTRKSLLAWAQSQAIANEVMRLNPDIEVELCGIETQGDKILDKPLSEIEGKEFFTAELDHALINGEVDFTVHSMKDLSLDRPQALKIAAIPKRELPHDLAVFHASVIGRLTAGLPIRVGTSSPRRLTLVPSFLAQALPTLDGKAPIIEMHPIRGNVNTRLSRIHEEEGSERKLDAVILAFAGLERLAQDEAASHEVDRLFLHTLKMVLPIHECPTAPAQGALAIETRRDHHTALTAIQKLHDTQTEEDVAREREILKEWGGGCHQKLGATYANGTLTIRGEKPSGATVIEARSTEIKSTETRTQSTQALSPLSSLPAHYRKVSTEELFTFTPFNPEADHRTVFDQANAAFVGHFRAFEHLPKKLKTKFIFQSHVGQSAQAKEGSTRKSIWVPGTKTWFKLAREGVWVEGCTDGLGIGALENFAEKNLLSIREKKWAFLTHAESRAMNPDFTFEIDVVPTYAHQFKSVPDDLKQATHIHWSSGLAFTAVHRALWPEDREQLLKKTHSCGPGRTRMVLENHQITPEFLTQQD